MSGFIGLGGKFAAPLFATDISSAGRIVWGINGTPSTINLPQRSKSVDVIGDHDVDSIAHLDGLEGERYLDKLKTLNFSSTLLNYNEDRVLQSLAIVNTEDSLIGITDTDLSYSYLAWGDSQELSRLLAQSPLRYLIYRFGKLPTFFLPLLHLHSRWRRWESQGLLLAYNALERRLT